jgi:hypothetical protein
VAVGAVVVLRPQELPVALEVLVEVAQRLQLQAQVVVQAPQTQAAVVVVVGVGRTEETAVQA